MHYIRSKFSIKILLDIHTYIGNVVNCFLPYKTATYVTLKCSTMSYLLSFADNIYIVYSWFIEWKQIFTIYIQFKMKYYYLFYVKKQTLCGEEAC